MSKEELLQLLQEKGLDDDSIRALLQETLDVLSDDFADHDAKEEDERKVAGKLLGVEL
jgi:hypothetical protein